MDIGDLLSRDGVAVASGASSKRQALSRVADLAARSLSVPSAELLIGLMEREALGSTGLGGGVAVPHARLPVIPSLTGVFIRLDTPVAFEAVDDRPVDLIFALFAPHDAGADHLRALAAVSRTLRRPRVREELRAARSADSLYALLLQDRATEVAA